VLRPTAFQRHGRHSNMSITSLFGREGSRTFSSLPSSKILSFRRSTGPT
jgi:hypothetical protein